MGMTPGVRQVAHRLAEKVVCIDKSDAAIEMLRDALPTSDRRNEEIIQNDWANMPGLIGDKVELIMGDGVFANLLDHGGQIEVLKAVRGSLIPGGAFVSRCLISPDGFDLKAYDKQSLLARYRSGEIGEGEFGHAMRVWGFHSGCYDGETFILDNAKVYRNIDAMSEAGELTGVEREILQRYYFGGRHFYPTQEYWEGALSETGFEHSSTWLSGRFYNGYLPIYLCKNVNG